MVEYPQEQERQDNYLPSDVLLLEQIAPLARQINCLSIGNVASICIKKIPEMVGARFASIYILDDATQMLHLQKHNHPFPLNKIVSINQDNPSPMVMAVRSKEIIMVGDIDTHNSPTIKRSQRTFAKNYKTNNCVIVPLICHEKVVGVLNLADKTDGKNFQKHDIALIELFSQLIGASIENIKLFERTQKQATTDGLTGLANHRTFYDVLEKELWRSKRYGGSMSMIMIDIDDLKKVNDKYGHRAGDKVIKQVSQKIKECIRQIDTAARYGGDEFAVILPNTKREKALFVAERMLEAVSNSPVTWKSDYIMFSISIGLGEYDHTVNPEDVTSSSDEALYIAKQAGKCTVKVFQPSCN